MKNWALVALAAFLPRRPAPGLLGDDVEVDRRRPRTLVEDFIKDARPYESALPNGVEPAAEVLQHFPETSFERCPELEAFTEKIRAASTSCRLCGAEPVLAHVYPPFRRPAPRWRDI